MRFLPQFIFILLVSCWLLFFAIGSRLANAIGTRLGAIIQRVGKGKISDPVLFTYERGTEFLILLTLFCLLVLLLWGLARFARTRQWRYAWIAQGIAAFVALNLWIAAATQTALFWGAMFTGSRTANFTQFQFKRSLLGEHKAPRSALLLGSSQTQAQIDENQLNALIGSNIWTTELHFPGSAGLDVFLIYENLRRFRADFLLIYLSENNFFNGLHTEAPPFFARLEHIPIVRSFGLGSELASKSFRYGYLAEVLPLFRAREAITHRLLGPDIALLSQATQDAALDLDLEARAESVARLFQRDKYPSVHERAFEEFVRRASKDGRKVILFEGQLNPVLARRLPPEMRAQMKRFLADLAARYPNVELVHEEKLPPQSPSDYADLTHVTPAVQQKFTSWLAEFLQERVRPAAK
jgi:hypothetical protein